MKTTYKSVDGRIYTSEKSAAPLPVRSGVITSMRINEEICLRDILRIENLFGAQHNMNKMLSKEEKERITEEYGLSQKSVNGRWCGNKEMVFEAICARYPEARKYKKYSGILYAMRYGSSPCTVYYETKA